MAEQGLASPGADLEHALTHHGPGFFASGDGQALLEQLQPLFQGERRALLVTGCRGVGKSTLCRQLYGYLAPGTGAVRINAALVSGDRELLDAMGHGFGVVVPTDADGPSISELIAAHARARDDAGSVCVALVDDAELLEPRALEHLVRLAADSPLRIVLFGEVRLSGLARGLETSEVTWHEIHLKGFDLAEVRGYLEWRFRQQGHTTPLPFSDRQIKDIARLSRGLPGRIDEMANLLLVKLRSLRDEQPGRAFPVLHQALLAALGVVLALVYLLWPSATEPEQTLTGVEALEVPAPVDPSPPGNAGVVQREVPAEPSGQSEARGPENPAHAPPVEAAPQQDASAGDAGGAVGAGSSAGAAARDGHPQTAPWVMGQPATAYTLQLATFSTAERAAAYLARQDDPASFARFRVQQAGRILHVVVYGSFDDRQAAEEAARRLPEAVGDVEPWVRPFSHVQDAVRTALQQQGGSGTRNQP